MAQQSYTEQHMTIQQAGQQDARHTRDLQHMQSTSDQNDRWNVQPVQNTHTDLQHVQSTSDQNDQWNVQPVKKNLEPNTQCQQQQQKQGLKNTSQLPIIIKTEYFTNKTGVNRILQPHV